MVAFDKCDPTATKMLHPIFSKKKKLHPICFFLDSLINSAKDVGLLHYYGVLHHSLGSNREVAKLVNNLYKEVSPDVSKSYLYKVVRDVNEWGSFGKAQDLQEKLHKNIKFGASLKESLLSHHISRWGSFGNVPSSLRQHSEDMVSAGTENKALDHDHGDTKNCQ
ncbi:hypothetical protein ACLB2K_062726 [Fragaria x ananassa]